MNSSNSSTKRLSEAFPPTSLNNQHFVSNIHASLKDVNIEKADFENIIIRKIKNRKELDQIQLLHKEWFPINYTKEYFEAVYQEKTNGLVAEIKLKNNDKGNGNDKVIVGCILYCFRNSKKKYMETNLCDFFKNYRSIYVMTIGVINEFRKHGIATKLLREMIQRHGNDFKIKYVYLHVVEYNHSAHRFYENNKFSLLKVKRKHYTIEESKYDAFVYIYYLHNTKPPVGILSSIRTAFGYLNLPKYAYRLGMKIYGLFQKKPVYNNL